MDNIKVFGFMILSYVEFIKRLFEIVFSTMRFSVY